MCTDNNVYTPEMYAVWTSAKCEQVEMILRRLLQDCPRMTEPEFLRLFHEILRSRDFRYVAFERVVFLIQHYFDADCEKEVRFVKKLWKVQPFPNKESRLLYMLMLYFLQRRDGFYSLSDSRLRQEDSDIVGRIVIHLHFNDCRPYNGPYWDYKGAICPPCQVERHLNGIVTHIISAHLAMPVHMLRSDWPLKQRTGRVIVNGFINQDQSEFLKNIYLETENPSRMPRLTPKMIKELLRTNDIQIGDWDIIGFPDVERTDLRCKLYYRDANNNLNPVKNRDGGVESIEYYTPDEEEPKILEILHGVCRDGFWLPIEPVRSVKYINNLVSKCRRILSQTGFVLDKGNVASGWPLVGLTERKKPQVRLLLLFPVSSDTW